MDATLVLDLIREMCVLILKISAPVLIVSLVVGFVISLFQALTQIQESTLSFVPKLVAILVTFVFSFHYMLNNITAFMHRIFDHMTRVVL